MEDKTVNWNEIKFKIWVHQKWARIKNTAKEVGEWVIENPVSAMAILGTSAGVISKASKAYRTHAEDVRRRRDLYDPRTGRHTVLKRDLKNWESEEVDRRFTQNKESYVKICRDLNIPFK